MKPRNLLIGLLLCAASATAQDIITKTDGTKLDAKVEEITETVIKYRKASNPTGPLYSIPLTSVWTILYENGTTDTFTTPTTAVPQSSTSQTATTPQSSATPTDEELLRMSDKIYSSEQSGNVSDIDLIRMYKSLTPSDELRVKAKKKRLIGWIGGGVLLAAGISVGIGLYVCDYYITSDGDLPLIIIGSSAIAGAAWCTLFNLKANSLIRQAKEIEMYSSSIIENEVLRFGNNSLMAGASIMGNRLTHTQSLGLSVKLNF